MKLFLFCFYSCYSIVHHHHQGMHHFQDNEKTLLRQILNPLKLYATFSYQLVYKVLYIFYIFMQDQHCVKSVQIQSFFWSVFSCIRTEYGDLLRKSPYSVRIQENTDQKKLRIWTLFTQCSLPLMLLHFFCM